MPGRTQEEIEKFQAFGDRGWYALIIIIAYFALVVAVQWWPVDVTGLFTSLIALYELATQRL